MQNKQTNFTILFVCKTNKLYLQNKQTNFASLFVYKTNKQILQVCLFAKQINKFCNYAYYYNYNDYDIIGVHVIVVAHYNNYDIVGVFLFVVAYYNYNA